MENLITTFNLWQKLKYVEPKKALLEIRDLQHLIASSNLNHKIKNLRTQSLRKHREGWEAALFCYGLGKLLETTIYVCPYEKDDYDAIGLSDDGYLPIQIKEIVSEDLNPCSDINQEIAKLSKYSKTETTFVVHINRTGRLELSEIKVPKLNIKALWLLGNSSPDQSKWFIAGNLLTEPSIFEFDYPSDKQI